MKKTSILLFLSIFFVYSELAGANDSSNEWSSYSYGLYYKNLAVAEQDPSRKKEYFDKAIESFLKAGKFGIAMDRIYNELSDCYYYNFSINLSLEYARKSIAINNKQLDPYNNIFQIYSKLRNYDKAAAALEEYLALNPEALHVQFTLGEFYFQKMKDNDKAETALKKVMEIVNREPTAYADYYLERVNYYLGYIAYKKKRTDEALLFFHKAYDINNDELNTVYMLAYLHISLYHLPEAEFFAKRYLEKYPDNIAMNAVMGRIAYIGNSPDALGYLRIAREAKSVDRVLFYGLYYELVRDDVKAEKLLVTAVKYQPKYLSPHLALANIYLRKGEAESAYNEFVTAGVIAFENKLFPVARNCFTEAGRLKKDVPEIYFYLGKIYEELNNPRLAVISYKEAHRLKPTLDMQLHIGYLYAVNREYKKAFEHFEEAKKIDPKNSRPYFFRGLVSIWAENYPYAEESIQKAISLSNNDETYYFYLAIVREKRNKFPETVQALEKAIESNPRSARAFNYLGYLYAEKGIEIEKSLSLIRKALEIDPNNGAYLDSLGWVYFRKKEYKLALENLLEAERILGKGNDPDPAVYDHIGDTYNILGNPQKALEYWEKSVKIKSDKKIEKKIEDSKKGRGL